MNDLSLYLERAALHLNYIHTTHCSKYTEVTLLDVPNRVYSLRLFVENLEREVRMRDDTHTWTLTQRPYVPYSLTTYTHWWMCVYRDISPTSQIRVDVRMKSGHSVWAKYREAGEVIGLDGLFSDYWSSNNREFTVLSQSLSPPSPHRSNREGQRQLSLESIVAL